MAFIRKHINKAYIISGEPVREERWDYPLDAMREIVLNAIVHRDYASSTDSIVKIYDHKIEVINPGRLPEDITIERLLEGNYLSFTRNRKIAGMFKEVGLIEKYGTGIKRILKGFLDYGLPVPRFEQIGGMFRVTAFTQAESPAEKVTTGEVTEVVTGVVAGEVTGVVTGEVSQEIIRIATICAIPKSRKELMAGLGLKHEDHFREVYLLPAMETGIIEQTIPDKPTSRLQKYRLTGKGHKLLHPSQKGGGK
jgi:ATP-dependent DNA helicase RecG